MSPLKSRQKSRHMGRLVLRVRPRALFRCLTAGTTVVIAGLVVGGALVAGTSGAAGAARAAAYSPSTVPHLVPNRRVRLTGAPTLRVVGNRLVDAAGRTLRLGGVNRSGSEYACAQGWGIFDGPVDDASITAIASWHVNTVRVPLNEDCWLGINGVAAAYGGATYRSAITGLVSRLHAHGLAAVLDLHWAAPGSALATGQLQMPDADHSPAFWSSVASTFRTDPSVAFEVFNEPHDVSWECWRSGCVTPTGFTATGMQQLVTAVRDTGARQPVVVDGLGWGGDLSGWQANAPVDPARALVAGWHIYSFSGCNTTGCWDATAAPLATSVPVLLTEVGEDDCGTGFLQQILPWADRHGIGYLGWSWNTASCAGGPALITSYTGAPTAFGAGFKAHLAVLQASPAPAAVQGRVTRSGCATGAPMLRGHRAACAAPVRPADTITFPRATRRTWASGDAQTTER